MTATLFRYFFLNNLHCQKCVVNTLCCNISCQYTSQNHDYSQGVHLFKRVLLTRKWWKGIDSNSSSEGHMRIKEVGHLFLMNIRFERNVLFSPLELSSLQDIYELIPCLQFMPLPLFVLDSLFLSLSLLFSLSSFDVSSSSEVLLSVLFPYILGHSPNNFSSSFFVSLPAEDIERAPISNKKSLSLYTWINTRKHLKEKE